MILVIRISGMVDVNADIEETMSRLRLRRKYAAVLIKDNSHNRQILETLRNHVSYGSVSPAVIEALIKHRGVALKGKKIDAKQIAEMISTKNAEDLGMKPFFRLHPPRGGIESKKHAGIGKGVLGENKDIGALVRRML